MSEVTTTPAPTGVPARGSKSPIDTVTAFVKQRPELAAMAVLVLLVPLLPGKTPLGVVALGVVSATGLVLHSFGLILIYRVNRVINFSQVAIGAAAGTFFITWVRAAPLFRGLSTICRPCFDEREFRDVKILNVPTWLQHANYAVGILLAIAFALLLAAGCAFLAKRFTSAPRLIVTVSTIFLAQALAGIATEVSQRLAKGKVIFTLPPVYTGVDDAEELAGRGIDQGPLPPPFELNITIDDITFGAVQILTLVVTLLVGLALVVYFQRSSAGTAVRAVAENASRASTLGLNVESITRKIWVIAGGLSGTAGVLLAMSAGAQRVGSGIAGEAVGTPDFGLSLLVRILTVAVLARMVSLPMVAVGALVLGFVEQAVLWAYGSTVLVDGALIVVIVVVLLVQRQRLSRAEIEQAAAWGADREIRPIPAELKALPVVRSWLRTGATIGGIIVLGLPWILSPGETVLASSTVILAIVGLSLLVLTGWAGQISLGQFGLAAAAAYVVAVTTPPTILVLPVAALVGGLAALLLGLPALRLRGLHLAIVTLAFAVSSTAVLLNPQNLGKSLPTRLSRPGLLGLDLEDERIFYYVVLVLFALMVVGVQGLRRSRTARALIACRDNEPQAESFGINLLRARLLAFVISGALAGVAGALYAYAQHGVRAAAFPPDQSVFLFLVSAVGGFGTVAGPVIGVVVFGLLEFVNLGPYRSLILGIGGLTLTLFIGGGFSQLFVRMRDSMLRRVATRYGIVVPSLIADYRVNGTVEDKVKIAPKHRSGGGEVFVPTRYKVQDQWALGDVVVRQELEEAKGRSNG